MTFKIDPEITKRLKAQDLTMVREVLASLDKQLVIKLKQSKDDVRYIQGFSAAVDYLDALIKP
jgi:hypothetical protein